MRLINDSPRVEGNTINVDVDTDHPVQCSLRLATTKSPLRDCESMHEHFATLTYPVFIYMSCAQTGNNKKHMVLLVAAISTVAPFPAISVLLLTLGNYEI